MTARPKGSPPNSIASIVQNDVSPFRFYGFFIARDVAGAGISVVLLDEKPLTRALEPHEGKSALSFSHAAQCQVRLCVNSSARFPRRHPPRFDRYRDPVR